MTTNNNFTITLTPREAMQIKLAYESRGYQVGMMEICRGSFIDNTFKYHFTLSGRGGAVVIPNNNNLLEVA